MELKQLFNKPDKNKLIISYKLLSDLLFIEIIFFLLALVGEGLLPGTVTSHVGFSKILVMVGVTILAIFWIGIIADIEISKNKSNKKSTCLLIFVLILFLLANLIKVGIFLNLFLSFFVMLSAYYIYKMMFDDH